jgi:hypothetical protein
LVSGQSASCRGTWSRYGAGNGLGDHNAHVLTWRHRQVRTASLLKQEAIEVVSL